MSDTTTPTTRKRYFDLTVVLTYEGGESHECKTVMTIADFQRLVETCVKNKIDLKVVSAEISKSVS